MWYYKPAINVRNPNSIFNWQLKCEAEVKHIGYLLLIIANVHNSLSGWIAFANNTINSSTLHGTSRNTLPSITSTSLESLKSLNPSSANSTAPSFFSPNPFLLSTILTHLVEYAGSDPGIFTCRVQSPKVWLSRGFFHMPVQVIKVFHVPCGLSAYS